MVFFFLMSHVEVCFSDLSPLSNLPYLIILDASHNKLTSVLDFNPPKNLKDVDLSFNEIEEMSDLSEHHCLMKLNLDSILFCCILGLINLRSMVTLL